MKMPKIDLNPEALKKLGDHHQEFLQEIFNSETEKEVTNGSVLAPEATAQGEKLIKNVSVVAPPLEQVVI